MLKLNLQFFGGRSSSSGVTGGSSLYDSDGYRGEAVIVYNKYTKDYTPIVTVRTLSNYDDEGNYLDKPKIETQTIKGGFFKTKGDALDWLKNQYKDDKDIKLPKF